MEYKKWRSKSKKREREKLEETEEERKRTKRKRETTWITTTLQKALDKQGCQGRIDIKKAMKYTKRKLWKTNRKEKAKAARSKLAEDAARRAKEAKEEEEALAKARRRPMYWDSSNRVFFGRIVLSKKKHLWRKLDWVHRQKKGGLWVPRKMTKGHKRKLKMLNKDIKEAEEALVMMLPAYANATNLDSIVEEHTDYDLVLDSGAMMASGDANRVPGGPLTGSH